MLLTDGDGTTAATAPGETLSSFETRSRNINIIILLLLLITGYYILFYNRTRSGRTSCRRQFDTCRRRPVCGGEIHAHVTTTMRLSRFSYRHNAQYGRRARPLFLIFKRQPVVVVVVYDDIFTRYYVGIFQGSPINIFGD